MTNDEPTGPWVLALGALLIGLGAVTIEVLRRVRDRPTDGR
ncbi:hypothetical protein [Halegenticoccus soli]|nr:hypothetical protein [Halegenticoccus soli]